MPLFHYTTDRLHPVAETTFGAEGILERQDLQRLLREQIDALGERLLVIAEEFGDWADSARRIDLLCLDTDANLVVVELKRTEDGGHMELQALRYAAMVSTMRFEQLVDTHAKYLNRPAPDTDAARAAILGFLNWTEVDESQFAQDVRIVLASANFGRELTTAVMWLNERNLDIRCVRLKPYRLNAETVLLDVQQIIPLPEAAEFQTRIDVKKQAERQDRSDRKVLRAQFWEALLNLARPRSPAHAGRSATTDGWLSGSVGRAGFVLNYVVRRHDAQVELWIALGTGKSALNKTAFHTLKAQQAAIEADFGAPLEWQELPEGEGCRIRCVLPDGGYQSPAEQWPQIHDRMVDAMVRLDRAMRGRVAKLAL
jgi:hypothetical protein